MKKFLQYYKNPNEERINYGLINRQYDDDIVDYIVDCCKSLEVLQYVEFLGYEHIVDEASINTSEYIDAKTRTKTKKNDPTRYMYLQDNRHTELRLKFRLSCNDETEVITKKILVPIPDDLMYYTIKGNRYFLMYQVVDNSTYTTKKSLTLKSMMPVIMKVKQHTAKSTENISYTAPTYTINIFRKDVDIMLFYLAKIGIKKTLKYFSVDKIINFTSEPIDEENNIYFNINSKIFLEVNKHFFNKYSYVKTIAFMLLTITTNRLTIESLFDKRYWIEAIGALGTTNKNSQYEKGINTLTFFDRIIDDTTKRILKVHPIHKKNIYSILRWMIMNFNELRKKDNLDLGNKRLRCNEYIASLLTKAFSERVNRIISLGNKVTLKNVKDIFKFPGDILINQLHRSGLLRYDDRVNDMDFYGKLRVTFKGPNSLGNNNENNIAAKYRGIDPSYIGRLDINVCGTSDPGTSAILTPFCKTSGLYFDDEHEPEDFKYLFDKDISDELCNDDECLNITPVFNDVNSYFDFHLKNNENNKNIKMNKKEKKEDMYTIEIHIDDKDNIE